MSHHHQVVIHRQGWTLVLNPDGTTTAWNKDRTKVLHSHGPPPAWGNAPGWASGPSGRPASIVAPLRRVTTAVRSDDMSCVTAAPGQGVGHRASASAGESTYRQKDIT